MFATKFLDFATCWGLFLAVASFLNLFVREEFRGAVASYLPFRPTTSTKITRETSNIRVDRLASLFVKNTLVSFFGINPFTMKAAIRSIALSTGFTVIVVVVMLINDFKRTTSIASMVFDENPFWTILALIFFYLMEWLSFLQTYFVMRLAAKGSLFRIIFLAYADVVLSVNIFLFMFPFVGSALMIGYFERPYSADYELRMSFQIDGTTREGHGTIQVHYLFAKDFADFASTKLPEFEVTPKVGEWEVTVGKEAIFNAQFILQQYYPKVAKEIGLLARVQNPILSNEDDLVPPGTESHSNIEHKFESPPRTFSKYIPMLYHMYGQSFMMAQSIQLGLPEILWKKIDWYPFYGYLSTDTNLVTNFYNKVIQRFLSPETSIGYFNLCGQSSLFLREPPAALCPHGMIIKVDVNDFARIQSSGRIGFPGGIFLLGAFCFTFVFYVSLIIFIFLVRVVSYLPHTSSAKILSLLDISVIRANAVLFIIGVGSFPISVLIVLLK